MVGFGKNVVASLGQGPFQSCHVPDNLAGWVGDKFENFADVEGNLDVSLMVVGEESLVVPSEVDVDIQAGRLGVAVGIQAEA